MVLMLKNLSNSWEKKFNKYDTGSIAKNKNKKIRSNVQEQAGEGEGSVTDKDGKEVCISSKLFICMSTRMVGKDLNKQNFHLKSVFSVS